VQEFIDEYPKRPDVGLGAINIVDEAFGRHVDGGSDVDVFEFIP
jgi:hypothetical protein